MFHATHTRSQRLAHDDHSGWMPGLTRPSSVHLIAMISSVCSVVAAAVTSGANTSRNRVQDWSSPATSSLNHSISASAGTTGTAKRASSHSTRAALLKAWGA